MKTRAILATAALAACTLARADDQVQIYGVLDQGITYVSNSGGKPLFLQNSGAFQPNSLGFRGSEDLGGGYKAIFQLESGFALESGSLIGGANELFGRETFLGMTTPYGTLTMGRLPDFMYPLNRYSTVVNVAGLVAAAPEGGPGSPAMETRISGDRTDDSVRWVSTLGNWKLGAMATLAGDGESGGSMKSGLIQYNNGTLSAGAAFTRDKSLSFPLSLGYAFVGQQVFGVGANYRYGKALFYGLYTDSSSLSTSDRTHALDSGVRYSISPALSAAIGFTYDWLRIRTGAHGNIFQVAPGVDYYLSKRTDVYVAAAYIHNTGAAGDATIGIPGGQFVPSTKTSEIAARVGLRHVF
jgi:predicted porin